MPIIELSGPTEAVQEPINRIIELTPATEQPERGIADIFTGAERIAERPELGTLPEFGGTTEGDVPGIALGFLSTFDPKAQQDIIAESIPEAKFETFDDGTTIIEVPTEEGGVRRSVLNRPGFSPQDLLTATAQVLSFVPAARIASLGKTLAQKVGIGATAAGATEQGLQETGAALGREERDPTATALAAGLGGVAEVVVPAVQAFRSARQAKKLGTGREELDQIAPTVEAATEATEATGIPLFQAQQTLVPTQLERQAFVTQLPAGTQAAVKGLKEQNKAAGDAVETFINQIAPPEAVITGAEKVRTAAQNAVTKVKEIRKEKASPLFNRAFAEGADVDLKPVNDLISAELADLPATGEIAKSLNKVQSLIGGKAAAPVVDKWFHGTASKNQIEEFPGMVWGSSNKNLAKEYAAAKRSELGGSERVMEFISKAENVLDGDAIPKNTRIDDFFDVITEQSKVGIDSGVSERIVALKNKMKAGARIEESGPNYSPFQYWHRTRNSFGDKGEAAFNEALDLLDFDAISVTELGEKTLGIRNSAKAQQVKPAVEAATKKTSLQLLHNAKLEIDQMLNKFGENSLGNTTKAKLTGVKATLLQQIDEASDAYRVARETFAAESPAVTKIQESIVGKIADLDDTQLKQVAAKIFDPAQTNPQVLLKAKKSITDVDPDAWNEIVRVEMERRLGAIKSTAEAGTVENIPGQLFRALFPNDKSTKVLMNALDSEGKKNLKFLQTSLGRARLGRAGGSQTAAREEIKRELRGGVSLSIRNFLREPITTITKTGEDTVFNKRTADLSKALFDPTWKAEMKKIRRLDSNSPAAARAMTQLLNDVGGTKTDSQQGEVSK